MPRMQITIRLKNAPPLTFATNIATARDLPRFLASASKACKNALRVYPVIADHAVEKITVGAD